MAQPIGAASRPPAATALFNNTAPTGTQQGNTAPTQNPPARAQGYNWSKIGAYTFLGAGIVAGVGVIAATVMAVAGSKNVFLMGDTVGFSTQPLSFSATIGTLAVAGTALASTGLLIGGGIWVHKVRKAEEEKAAADKQAADQARATLIARLTPRDATFDKVLFNQYVDEDKIPFYYPFEQDPTAQIPQGIVNPRFELDKLLFALENDAFNVTNKDYFVNALTQAIDAGCLPQIDRRNSSHDKGLRARFDAILAKI